MEICIGMIGISPTEFWNCSPKEIYAMIDGFREFHSGGKDATPMTKDELHELMELYPD